jgi:hypothetical protein
LIKAIEKTEWVTVLYVNVPGITGGIYPGKPRGLLGAARLLLKRWAFDRLRCCTALATLFVSDLEVACAVALNPTLDPSMPAVQLLRMREPSTITMVACRRTDCSCKKCSTRAVNEGADEGAHGIIELRKYAIGRGRSSEGLSEYQIYQTLFSVITYRPVVS